MIDAHVACRELGFKRALRALQGSQVPDGSGKIWLDDVNCRGTEISLASCPHRGFGNHNCRHNEDAGVVCSNKGIVNKQSFFHYFPFFFALALA